MPLGSRPTVTAESTGRSESAGACARAGNGGAPSAAENTRIRMAVDASPSEQMLEPPLVLRFPRFGVPRREPPAAHRRVGVPPLGPGPGRDPQLPPCRPPPPLAPHLPRRPPLALDYGARGGHPRQQRDLRAGAV